jgi:hypothetical protein
MSIAIIGHGPSLLHSNMGDKINSYDTVIRQKAVSHQLVTQLPKDFGTKTSIICGSYTIREALFWDSRAKVWVFTDSRHDSINIENDSRFTLLKEDCENWNNIYRSLRTENYIPNSKMTKYPTSSDIGHNHMSCGLHTILYACILLKPSHIALFGFDNLKTGDFTWSVTRGERWDKYPDHRWDVENKLIDLIKDKYSVELQFI